MDRPKLIRDLTSNLELGINFASGCPNFHKFYCELKAARRLLLSDREDLIPSKLPEVIGLLGECADLARENSCHLLAAELEAAFDSASVKFLAN